MAQKKKTEEKENKKEGPSFLTGVVEKFASSIFLDQLMDKLKEAGNHILKKVQDMIYLTEKKILQTVVSVIFLVFGLIFIFISLVMFINDYFNLHSYVGYFIVGLVIALASLISLKIISKNKHIKEDC